MDNEANGSLSTACEQMSEENKASEQYLELYKLAVEMADRVSARRATANAFFLTVNTALLAFIGSGSLDVLWLVTLAGIALSGSWWILLKSYRDLNAAKFGVILQMEENLEASVYGDEWAKVKELRPKEESPQEERPKRWWEGYAELGQVERTIPLIFAALYAAVFVQEWL
jgi:hypothetical protein